MPQPTLIPFFEITVLLSIFIVTLNSQPASFIPTLILAVLNAIPECGEGLGYYGEIVATTA
jgi:hypothetical protein